MQSKKSETNALPPVIVNQVLIAVRQAANLICDRWTLLLVLLLLSGFKTFSVFRDRLKISNRSLNTRLKTLLEYQLIQRVPYQTNPLRYEYLLTQAGQDCFIIFLGFYRWQNKWNATTNESLVSIKHTQCGKQLSTAQTHCLACEKIVDSAKQILRTTTATSIGEMPQKSTRYRFSNSSGSNQVFSKRLPLANIMEIFGDKWTIELIVCAFLRISSFNDFAKTVSISTNILSSRLNHLVACGIFCKSDMNELPGNVGSYYLSQKGRDLYPILVVVETWADHWLAQRQRSPLRLIHSDCKNRVELKVFCDHCFVPVDYQHCEFDLSLMS